MMRTDMFSCLVSLRANVANLLVAGGLALASVNCTNPDDEVFSINDGKSPRQLSAEEGTKPNLKKAVPIALASYEVKIFGERGLRLCIGAIDMQLMSDLTFGESSGGIRCLGKKIDMGSMLQGLSGSAMAKGDVESDGQMIRANRLGNVQFQPSRPLLVGPIVQNPAEFMNLDETSSHVAIYRDPVTGQQSQGSGSLRVKVLEVNGTYEANRLGRTLNRVLHWEMTSSGFDGISKSEAFVFDRFEVFWNTRPLVVPKIIIQGAIESFISADDSPFLLQSNVMTGAAGLNLVGDAQKGGIISNILPNSVRIELEATRFEGL